MNDDIKQSLDEILGEATEKPSLRKLLGDMSEEQFVKVATDVSAEYQARLDASTKLGDLTDAQFEEYKNRVLGR